MAVWISYPTWLLEPQLVQSEYSFLQVFWKPILQRNTPTAMHIPHRSQVVWDCMQDAWICWADVLIKNESGSWTICLLHYTFEPALFIYTTSLTCQRYPSLPTQLSHKISRVPVLPYPTRKKTESHPEVVSRCSAMSSYKTCLLVTEFPRWCAHLPNFLLDLVTQFGDL